MENAAPVVSQLYVMDDSMQKFFRIVEKHLQVLTLCGDVAL